MTTQEASEQSGLTSWTISQAAKRGDFAATQPNGRRGGWDINEASFRQWVARRRIQHGNRAFVALANRGALA